MPFQYFQHFSIFSADKPSDTQRPEKVHKPRQETVNTPNSSKKYKNDKRSDVSKPPHKRDSQQPLRVTLATGKPSVNDTRQHVTAATPPTTTNRRNIDLTTPTSSRAASAPAPTPRTYAPFRKLLRSAVYAMSGYQNPKRSQIRDKLTAMGATYKADWDKTCTHLM